MNLRNMTGIVASSQTLAALTPRSPSEPDGQRTSLAVKRVARNPHRAAWPSRVASLRHELLCTAMNRLQAEMRRLYLPSSAASAENEASSAVLIDPHDRVRAMVLELTRPPSWEVLSRVWHGVQAELELPAPAIAVSGVEGLQLWFSLAEPITVAQAHAFLESLRSRFLPDIDPGRLCLMPALHASALRQELHARTVPARQELTGDWSAFVAPDLAPVFSDTPWLDIPPNEEGQAALLRGLDTMKQVAFEAALRRLGPSIQPPRALAVSMPSVDVSVMHIEPVKTSASGDPKRFLLQIMNDDTVALALRIEAAKALLPYSNDH